MPVALNQMMAGTTAHQIKKRTEKPIVHLGFRDLHDALPMLIIILAILANFRLILQYSLFSTRKSHSPARINEEQSIPTVNRKYVMGSCADA